MSWVLWGVMLLLQNASFTWVSRARNSRSLRYHAAAAVASNGVFFLNLGLAVDKIQAALHAPTWNSLIVTTSFYTVFTVIGAVSTHHFLMVYVETGARRPE